jgi:hypothetical protein
MGMNKCNPLSHLGQGDKWKIRWVKKKKTVLSHKGKRVVEIRGKKLSLLKPYLILRIPRGHLFQKFHTKRD